MLLAFKAVAVMLLWLWLAHAKDRLTALSLGLIIGGAFGNAIDRLAYGWVADFVFFTFPRPIGGSTGTFLTSPMWPSLPGLLACCMTSL